MKLAAKIALEQKEKSKPRKEYSLEELAEMRRNRPKVGYWSLVAERMRHRRENPDELFIVPCLVRNDVSDRLDEWCAARGLSTTDGIDLLLMAYDEREADDTASNSETAA